MFSMKRLAVGPIDPYAVDRRDKANVLERERILKGTTRLLFERTGLRECFYTAEAYFPGSLVCIF